MHQNKILYIGPFQMPDRNAAAHRVLNNAKIFRDYGYETVFIGCNPLASTDILKTKFEHENFHIFEIKGDSTKNKIIRFSDMKYIDSVLSKYNDMVAIVAYDYYSLGLIKLRDYFRRKNIPLFVDTDEWFVPEGKVSLEKVIRIIDSELRMRFIQKKVDGVIAISSFLFGYYSKNTTTIQIPPLVDKLEHKWNRQRYSTTNSNLELVYAGSPGTKDKIDVLVRVLANNSFKYKIILNVVGITEKEFLQVYSGYEDMLANSKNTINFLGRLNHEEAITYVAEADFSCFIRNINKVSTAGFPTKFVESISCGTPVITNSTSNISDYLKSGKNGFLLTNDIENQLVELFNRDLHFLKSIRDNVNDRIFDYHNYSSLFLPLITILQE